MSPVAGSMERNSQMASRLCTSIPATTVDKQSHGRAKVEPCAVGRHIVGYGERGIRKTKGTQPKCADISSFIERVYDAYNLRRCAGQFGIVFVTDFITPAAGLFQSSAPRQIPRDRLCHSGLWILPPEWC